MRVPVDDRAVRVHVAVERGRGVVTVGLDEMLGGDGSPAPQGEMLGLNTGAMALARIGGPVVAGQLFSLVAPGAPFPFSALMVLPAIWFAWTVVQRTPRLA